MTTESTKDSPEKTSQETTNTESHTSLALRDGFAKAVQTLSPERKQVTGDSQVIARIPLKQRTTDELINLIDSGKFLIEIAREWRVDNGDLNRWIAADNQRSASARLARKNQAIFWDYQAEQVLKNLPADGTPAQIVRARELASHYRWRAKCFNPGDYGDHVQVTHDDNREARELTTAELQIIAAGGVLPGGLQ